MRDRALIVVLLAAVAAAKDPPNPEAELVARAEQIRTRFRKLKKLQAEAIAASAKLAPELRKRIAVARKTAFKDSGLGTTVAPFLVALSRHMAEAQQHQVAKDKLSFMAELLSELSRFTGDAAKYVDAKVAKAGPAKASDAESAARTVMAEADKVLKTKEGMLALRKVPMASEFLEINDPMQEVINDYLEIFRKFSKPLGKIVKQPDTEQTKARNASIRAALKLMADWQKWARPFYQSVEDGAEKGR